MKGDAKVIDYLQQGLKLELTAVNQFFLHARMYDDMGLFELGKKEYQESIEEMHHADRFIKRILFLEGLPNLQDLDKIRVGETPREMLECDLAGEQDARALYVEAIAHCEQVQDYVSRDLFADLLADEEGHIDFLETQLALLQRMGEQNYIQTQTGDANQEGGET